MEPVSGTGKSWNLLVKQVMKPVSEICKPWNGLKPVSEVGVMKSKKISNNQELIQSDPISCPQNQKGNN